MLLTDTSLVIVWGRQASSHRRSYAMPDTSRTMAYETNEWRWSGYTRTSVILEEIQRILRQEE
jgi:hypothetical protein